jgi:hypothetical protein
MPGNGIQTRIPACEPSSYTIPTTSDERLAARLNQIRLPTDRQTRHRQPTRSLFGAHKRAHLFNG